VTSWSSSTSRWGSSTSISENQQLGLERETGIEPATLSLGKYESGIAAGRKASQAIVTTRSADDTPFQPTPPEAAIRRDFASPLLPDLSASLTVKEVAARLRVCTATVYRLCTTGELSHFRVGASIRIREKDLVSFRSLRTPDEPR
jgi:excisionase family DNA binding protein